MKEPVWPDLVKFHDFGEILKVFDDLMRVYLTFGKTLNLLWSFLFYWTNFHCCEMTKCWKTKLAVWSHWKVHIVHLPEMIKTGNEETGNYWTFESSGRRWRRGTKAVLFQNFLVVLILDFQTVEARCGLESRLVAVLGGRISWTWPQTPDVTRRDCIWNNLNGVCQIYV